MNKIQYVVNSVKKTEYILLLLIVLLGFVIRLYKIDNPIADWHSWRQTATANVARIYVDEGIDLLHPKYYDISTAQTGYENPEGYWFVEFPLYGLIHANLYRMATGVDFVIIGRMISVVASTISIMFVYLIGKKHMSVAGGLVAAFFFAFIPFNIYFSRVILPEPLAVAFGLASIWSFSKFVNSKTHRWLYLSAILFAVSILVKPFTLFYGMSFLYLAWKKYGKSGVLGFFKKKELWLFLIISIAPFVFWRFWMSQYPEGIPHTKWAFNGDGIRFRSAFWRWMAGERLGKLILGVWGIIPFVFGVISFKNKYYFFHWFLVGSFIFITIFATANVRHDYYQTVTIPAICFMLALGSMEMWNTPKAFNKLITRLVLVFSIFMMLGMSWYSVREFYKINRPEIVLAGARVNEIVPKEALVVAPYNKDTAFLYHTYRRGWPFVQGNVEELINKGADYYVSVNFDPVTLSVMEKYEVIEKTDKYVLINLGKNNY